MKEKLKVITLKVNSGSYGADPVPTAAANVLLAYNFEVQPLEMELDADAPVLNTFGENGKIIGAQWSAVSFEFLVRGGGTPLGGAGTVPNYDPVYLASAMARTLDAGVSTTYSNVDSGEQDAAIYYWNDGVQWQVLGLRGTLEWNYTSKRAARCSFRGMGLKSLMTDLAMATPTLPTPPKPVAVNKANTTLSINSLAVKMSSLVITQGNDMQYTNRTGREEVMLADRKTSGKVTFELPLVATQDFIGAAGICTLGTEVPLILTHGTAAGNIVTHVGSLVQLLSPKVKPEQGMQMLECDLHFVRNGHTVVHT